MARKWGRATADQRKVICLRGAWVGEQSFMLQEVCPCREGSRPLVVDGAHWRAAQKSAVGGEAQRHR